MCTDHQVVVVVVIIMSARKLSRYSTSVWAERSGDRIPVGVRFTAPLLTAPGTHPASPTVGTGYIFRV